MGPKLEQEKKGKVHGMFVAGRWRGYMNWCPEDSFCDAFEKERLTYWLMRIN